MLSIEFRILAGKGNAGSRNSEHSPRPCYETGLLPFFSWMLMRISGVKQGDVLIRVGLCTVYAGIGWFPGKSQGCTGTYKESYGDEQDSKAGQRWNCPDEVNLWKNGTVGVKEQSTIMSFSVTNLIF